MKRETKADRERRFTEPFGMIKYDSGLICVYPPYLKGMRSVEIDALSPDDLRALRAKHKE